jgi:hypothetical protein
VVALLLAWVVLLVATAVGPKVVVLVVVVVERPRADEGRRGARQGRCQLLETWNGMSWGGWRSTVGRGVSACKNTARSAAWRALSRMERALRLRFAKPYCRVRAHPTLCAPSNYF